MANEGEERIVMDLEVRLKDDQDGSVRSEVAAGIDEQIAAIDASLKTGVPPAEYQKLNTIKSGTGVGEPRFGQGLVVLSRMIHPSCASEGHDGHPCSIPHWFAQPS